MEEDLTKKFKQAIQDKLVEYEAFHDDELPQYIMVMVANKKSRESMENDLSLFLGKNTGRFTIWLHHMINKIEMSKDGSIGLNTALNNKNEEAMLLDKEDENILSLNSQEPDDYILAQELQGDLISHKELESHNSMQINKLEEKQMGKRLYYSKNEVEEIKKPSSSIKKFNCKSTVTSLKRSSTVLDEYDPMNPSVKSVASVVTVSERKSSVPVSLQANKLLLFKAIEDANKSVMSKNIDEMYKPTPIKTLNSFKEQLPEQSKQDSPSDDFPSCKSDFSVRKRFASEDIRSVPVHNNIEFQKVHNYLFMEGLRYSPEPAHDIVESFPVSDFELQNNLLDILPADESNECGKISPRVRPHFVVTLDGLDINSFKGKWTDDAFSESMETEEVKLLPSDHEENGNKEICEKADSELEKTPEKCRYWPSCKKGGDCTFHHPVFPCESFPKCAFGDKCHFIHPDCKFDTLCSRRDCPYAHKNRKDISGNQVSNAPHKKYYSPVIHQKSIRCKYFPKCNSRNCPFDHPKKCKYGNKCRAAKCPFLHPSFPTRNQLKWKSASSF